MTADDIAAMFHVVVWTNQTLLVSFSVLKMNNAKNITEKALTMLRSLPRVGLDNLRDDPLTTARVSLKIVFTSLVSKYLFLV